MWDVSADVLWGAGGGGVEVCVCVCGPGGLVGGGGGR